LLAIVEASDRANRIENDGAGDDRAEKAAAPDLIDARNHSEAARSEAGFECAVALPGPLH
jgi:hypothetical protein